MAADLTITAVTITAVTITAGTGMAAEVAGTLVVRAATTAVMADHGGRRAATMGLENAAPAVATSAVVAQATAVAVMAGEAPVAANAGVEPRAHCA